MRTGYPSITLVLHVFDTKEDPMTLSPTPSRFARSTAIAVIGALYTTFTFGALVTPTAAEAQSSTVYYTAELATPAKEARTIAKGMVWHCEGTRCVAAKNNSRPNIACERLTREVGELTKFTAKGVPFDDEALAKCNGK